MTTLDARLRTIESRTFSTLRQLGIEPGAARSIAVQLREDAEAVAGAAREDTLDRIEARVREAQAELPKVELLEGEVLHTIAEGPRKGGLVTEVQRGSLRGQGAALGWMLAGIKADRT